MSFSHFPEYFDEPTGGETSWNIDALDLAKSGSCSTITTRPTAFNSDLLEREIENSSAQAILNDHLHDSQEHGDRQSRRRGSLPDNILADRGIDEPRLMHEDVSSRVIAEKSKSVFDDDSQSSNPVGRVLDLSYHSTQTESGATMYACPCDPERLYDRISELDRHQQKHRSPPYHCKDCSISFYFSKDLRRHYNSLIHKPPSEACPYCERRFTRRDLRDRHSKICINRHDADLFLPGSDVAHNSENASRVYSTTARTHATPSNNESDKSHTSQKTIGNRIVSAYWSDAEENDLLRFTRLFGRDFAAIAEHMGTKTSTMIKNRYQSWVDRGNAELEKAAIEAGVRRSRVEDTGMRSLPEQAQGLEKSDPQLRFLRNVESSLNQPLEKATESKQETKQDVHSWDVVFSVTGITDDLATGDGVSNTDGLISDHGNTMVTRPLPIQKINDSAPQEMDQKVSSGTFDSFSSGSDSTFQSSVRETEASRPTNPTTQLSHVDSIVKKAIGSIAREEDATVNWDNGTVCTDGRELDLSEDWRSYLTEELVVRILNFLDDEAMEIIYSRDNALTDVETLLRIFAVSTEEITSNNKLHEQAVTCVRRHRRKISQRLEAKANGWEPSVADNPSLKDKMDLLLRPRPEYTSFKFIGGDDGTTHMPEPPDVAEARRFLLASSGLTWLIKQFSNVASMQQTGRTYFDIKQRTCALLESLPKNEGLVMKLDWNPREFLNDKRQYRSMPKLSDVIVYCGAPEVSYSTTLSDYITLMWPDNGQLVTECFQRACLEPDGIAKATTRHVALFVQLETSFSRIQISEAAETDDHSRSMRDRLEIAEICAWLTTACRANDIDEGVGICVPNLIIGDNTPAQLSVSPACCAVSQTPGQALCWTGMVRNPVIAAGYPVPARAKAQRGLEVSPSLLIGLSLASWATTFDNKFILMGLVSALVPTLVADEWIDWHFLVNQTNDRITYTQACASACSDSAQSVDPTALLDRRHFVGVWAPHVINVAATDDKNLYALGPSSSLPAKGLLCSLSNINVNVGKILSIGAGLAIGRKDRSTALGFSASQPYELHVQHVSKFKVLCYGTQDRRGWLIDGVSALLHLARAWMHSESAAHMLPRALDLLQSPKWPGGKEAALTALRANKCKGIDIFPSERTQSSIIQDHNASDAHHFPGFLTTDEQQDRRFSMKTEVKITTSTWTYEDLIIDLAHLLKAMHDKLHSLDYRPPEFSMKAPTLNPALLGFEVYDLITSCGPFRPRRVELSSVARDWSKFVSDEYVIVLLARTFGDLVRPECQPQACLRTSTMHAGHDLLAVPMEVLKDMAKRWETSLDCDITRHQIADLHWWYDFNSALHQCKCRMPKSCPIYSLIGTKPSRSTKRPLPGKLPIYEQFPRGAAIIGTGTDRIPELHTIAKNVAPGPSASDQAAIAQPTKRRHFEDSLPSNGPSLDSASSSGSRSYDHGSSTGTSRSPPNSDRSEFTTPTSLSAHSLPERRYLTPISHIIRKGKQAVRPQYPSRIPRPCPRQTSPPLPRFPSPMQE